MFSDNPQPLGIETDRLEEIKSYYNKFKTKFPDFVFEHESWRHARDLEGLPRYLNASSLSSKCYVYTKVNFDCVDGKYIYKTKYRLMDLMMTLMKMHILSDNQWHRLLEETECFDFNDDYEYYAKKLLKILNRYYYEAHLAIGDILTYIVREFKKDGFFSESNLLYQDVTTYCRMLKIPPVVANCCKAVFDETCDFINRWPKAMSTIHERITETFSGFLIEKNDELAKQELSKRKKNV